MNKTVLEVKDMSVNLNGQVVLSNINFRMNRGEIAAVLGPNGAGKTTLIKAILGLIPYTGHIEVLGKPIKDVTKEVGYVPQNFSFDKTFPLTVCEFLHLTLKKRDRKKCTDVLREVEITDCHKKMIGELSGGQLQRVLIARALIHDPKILFLDEPTTGVDIEGLRTFYEIIEHLNKEHHVSIMMISHEINMVYTFATDVICLNKDLFCKGVPKDVITEKVLKQLYGDKFALKQHSHSNH